MFKNELAYVFAVVLLAGCAARGPYTTSRDNTVKGAAIGAAVGALFSVADGKREADEILARAAIGAVVGGGIGVYMDAQEEKIARIPGTRVERVSDDTLLIHFDSDLLFAIDSSTLTATSKQTLQNTTTVLNDFPKTAIIVQGHTDSTGSETHNQTLSERRAKAVLNYMVGRGVDPIRMVSMGYGESDPIASNENQSGRALNRRVAVMLRAKAK